MKEKHFLRKLQNIIHRIINGIQDFFFQHVRYIDKFPPFATLQTYNKWQLREKIDPQDQWLSWGLQHKCHQTGPVAENPNCQTRHDSGEPQSPKRQRCEIGKEEIKKKLKNKGLPLYIIHQGKIPIDRKKIDANTCQNFNQNMISPSTELVTRSPIYR